ncbi:Pyridine nucleotide-disulfide oxidoreductase class-II [Penicillium solitum]|uniref:Pyridine nucleotide-disulfide oxidoreductase class-II n=1 Tax=Penicillium solitum TaxID=60172 RepID=UPI0032C4A978|nr:Pyridine nucleotide-disulfide oxidoreductase class-II [Penicillium solitum]
MKAECLPKDQTGLMDQEINPKSLWSSIHKHAKVQAESVACSHEGKVLSYGELEIASLSLAALFHSFGIRTGDTVPVFVSRNLESVATIVALLRLGACFVPMDGESWSQSRVDSVLRAVEPKIVIMAQWTDLRANDTPVITMREVRKAFEQQPDFHADLMAGNIDCAGSPEEPVYIIFTSGTTGTPKGVMISRRSVENYVTQGLDCGMPFNLGVRNHDKVLLLFSLAFDAAWGVFFSSICHGAHLVLSEPRNVLEDAKRCTILPATPSLLANLGDPVQYKNIKSIFLGGESPNTTALQMWWNEGRSIYNCYGPTEATICASMAEIRPGLPINLGKAMSRTQLLILNDRLEECDEGELHISGPGLAIGYYKNEDLTSERFFEWNGLRIYATRDRARQSPEGIVFCGREDSMVKNRGYLVNLEMDVIPILESYPGVHAAAAFMHQGKLIGAVAPEIADVAEMRLHLSESHDQFVVPDRILAHKELCRTSNGKVDIQALKNILCSTNLSDVIPIENSPCTKLQEAVAETLGLAISSVSMERSFWELGGNSLLAIKLMSSLRQKGRTLQFDEILHPTALSVLSTKAKPIEENDVTPDLPSSIKTERTLSAPITTSQMGMIRSSIRHSATSYMLVRIVFPWKPEAGYNDRIRAAFETVMKRHTIFSTYFDMADGTQKLDPNHRHDWEEQLLAHNDISAAVKSESGRLFESTQRENDDHMYSPVNSFRLIVNQSATEGNLLWLVHHTCVDGWSMGLVIQEVQDVLQGKNLSLDPSQFLQIAMDLPQHLSLSHKGGMQFWKEAMSKVTETTQLKLPKPIGNTEGRQLGETEVTINLGIPQIKQICRINGVSSATMIYTAWALLLKSYTAQEQVVFGTVFSGRHLPVPGIEAVVGPVINSCPLPVCLTGLSTKASLLEYVQELGLQASSNQWSATEALQEIAQGAHSHAFQTMLFLEYDLPGFTNGDWKFTRTDIPEFGLTIIIRREVENLALKVIFDQNMYTEPVMERMMTHFRNLFLAMLDPTCETVAQVRKRMLEPCEALSLTTASPDLLTPYIGPSNLKESFETGVDQWPEHVAIESGTRTMTYRDLDLEANNFARAVITRVTPGSAVGIVSDRSVEWLVAVIGVIKAGAIYVPLDTKLPLERIQNMTQTADVQVCVFPNETCYAKFSEVFSGEKLLLSESIRTSQECARLETSPNPTDVAYITFTSGSTGTPKGVRIQHQSVVSYLSYGPARMDARPGRRHSQMFSPGFDVNQAEIFGTLCYGATLVLADLSDPFAHLTRVNATMITPSFLSVCEPEQFPNLDTILFAGEAVPQVLADRWADTRTVYNSYGPCECTIGCLFQPLRPHKEVTLGHAISRVGVYLLDPENHPVSIGVPGEICLSGIQIADGYIGADRQALSESRFVPNPFVPGQRMYRTGDCAIWTEDMEPKFLGRFDNQVKVRGYRVELNEIENVIRLVDPAVRRAAAVVNMENIIAYIEPDTVDVPALQAALSAKLPGYACPSTILALPSLPIMPNQKLDRKALLSISHTTQPKAGKPLTYVQLLVSQAWREAIGISQDIEIDAKTDFLELGGNSLSQIKLAQIVSHKLGSKLPLKLFIWTTELSALSDEIEKWLESAEKLSQANFSVAWRDIESPFTSPSDLEDEFVRLSFEYPSETFNVGYRLHLRGDVDLEILENSIQSVTSHEPVLKSRFYVIEDQVLRGQSTTACEITRGKMSDLDVEAFINRAFDLSTGPLTRINLSQSPDGVDMLFVQHHAVTDKAAIQILFRRIRDEYLSVLNGEVGLIGSAESTRLPDYTIWAQWKATQPQIGMDDPNTSYWRSQLSNMTVPLFKNFGGQSTFVGHSKSFSLKKNANFEGSMELYVALTAMTLARSQEATDMIIGIPHIDRTEPGTESLLGVFLDRLPVRLNVESTSLASFSNLVSSAQTSIRDALAYSIPLKRISQILDSSEIFQVMVVYNRRKDSVASAFCLPDVFVKETTLRPTGAKFPLLIEFTETEECTICEFEYMENVVHPTTAGHIREKMEKLVKDLGSWFAFGSCDN